MEGFELAATLVATSDFQNFFWGPWRAPGDPPGRGKRSVFAPSLGARLAAQDPLIFTRDYAAPGLLHCKYVAIRAVARDPSENEVIRADGHLGGTVGRPRSLKQLFPQSF